MREGMAVKVISGPYYGDEGTIRSMDAADKHVRVFFPHYGRRGRIVEMPVRNLAEVDAIEAKIS